jgi:hypothetical protein
MVWGGAWSGTPRQVMLLTPSQVFLHTPCASLLCVLTVLSPGTASYTGARSLPCSLHAQPGIARTVPGWASFTPACYT